MIRVRAERRAGQILKERDPAKGGRPPSKTPNSNVGVSDGPQPLSDLGISYNQSSTWKKLAEVPEDDFEAALAERRAGQILKERPPASGGDRRSEEYQKSRDTTFDPVRPPLSEIGITRDQSSTWKKLAEVPEDDFEAALAERRAGQILKERPPAEKGGDRKSEKYQRYRDSTIDPAPSPLSNLGISKNQSSTWQKLAEVPEDDFEATLAEAAGWAACGTFGVPQDSPEES